MPGGSAPEQRGQAPALMTTAEFVGPNRDDPQANYDYVYDHSDDGGGGVDDHFAVLDRYAAQFGHQQGNRVRQTASAPAPAKRQLPKPAFLRMPASDDTPTPTGNAGGGGDMSFNDLLQKALAATPTAAATPSQRQLQQPPQQPHQHQHQHQHHQHHHQETRHRSDGMRSADGASSLAPRQVTFVTKAVETALRVDMEHEAAEVAEFEELERSIILSQNSTPVSVGPSDRQHPRKPLREAGDDTADNGVRFEDVFSDDDDDDDDSRNGGFDANDRPQRRRPRSRESRRGVRGEGNGRVGGGGPSDGREKPKSSKYVDGLFQPGDHDDAPAMSVSELRRRETAVAEQERKLRKKLEDIGRESTANRTEKRRLAGVAKNLAVRERQLEADRRDFEEWCEGKRADVAVWRENEEEKIRTKMGAVDRKAKLLAAAPSRAERAEIQKLESLVDDLRKQEKRQADLAKQQLKRQQARISELTQRETELQEEIAVLVEERLTSPRATTEPAKHRKDGRGGGTTQRERSNGSRAVEPRSDTNNSNEHHRHRDNKSSKAAKKAGSKGGKKSVAGKKNKGRKSLAETAAEFEQQQQQHQHRPHQHAFGDEAPELPTGDPHGAGPEAVYANGQARVVQAYERRHQVRSSAQVRQPTPQPAQYKPKVIQNSRHGGSYLDVKRAALEQQQQPPQHIDPRFEMGDVVAEYPQSAEDFLHDDELVNEIVYEDRKIERQYASGRVEIVFRNGTQKQIFPDGNVIVKFTNGDMKRSTRDGLVVYFYAEAQTTHTTHPDGTEVFEFPNGQSERHLTDGSKSIRFNDGTLKKISPSGKAESIFPDGTRLVEHPNGVRDIYLADGTHTREQG